MTTVDILANSQATPTDSATLSNISQTNQADYTQQLILSKLINYQLKPERVLKKLSVNTNKLNTLESQPNLIKLRAKLDAWQACDSVNTLTQHINQLALIWLTAMQQGASLQDIMLQLKCFEIKSLTATNTTKFHCFMLDILAETSMQQQALKLDYLQNYDADTQLPNANQMIASIEKALSITQSDHYVGMFAIQFQLSNNNPVFTNKVATSLSKIVAEVLQMNVPAGNFIHYNGNLQFDILLPNLNSDIKLNLLAAKLQGVFEQILHVEKQSVLVTPYIGCASDLQSNIEKEYLLSNARLALESALQSQQSFLMYSDVLKKQLNTQNELENKVLEAFTNDSLTLFLQPVVNIKDAKCIGAELLLRLAEQSKLSVYPSLVVEILNKVGRGKLFTRWLINSACRYVAELKYEQELPIYLTINLRAEDLYDFELPLLLLQAVALWKISPADLVLEVTENGVLELNDTTNSVIKELAKAGFRLALDDFGTGFSSLSRLRNMPIDIIKIDQSFVRDITHSKSDYEIVKSIAALANSLGKEVIAEGVEDQKCLDLIKKMKIDKCQGYFYAKPMPFEQFVTWAKKHQ
jgi:EAL domain-containing protein (putative c-di-GMP-specific phosphodiesterase class I)/GGDEF domain-containing protein